MSETLRNARRPERRDRFELMREGFEERAKRRQKDQTKAAIYFTVGFIAMLFGIGAAIAFTAYLVRLALGY